MSITTLPTKKRGRPLLLGPVIDDKVQQYLKAIRRSGGTVNTAIAMAAAKGIVLKTDRTLLVEYGGHIDLHKDWAKWLLGRMGFVKRRGTTSVSKESLEQLKR